MFCISCLPTTYTTNVPSSFCPSLRICTQAFSYLYTSSLIIHLFSFLPKSFPTYIPLQRFIHLVSLPKPSLAYVPLPLFISLVSLPKPFPTYLHLPLFIYLVSFSPKISLTYLTVSLLFFLMPLLLAFIYSLPDEAFPYSFPIYTFRIEKKKL